MIKLDGKELFSEALIYNLVVFVNDKEVELSVRIDYDRNSMCENIDWEYLNKIDLTDEESDELWEYINSKKWLKEVEE